MSPQDINQLLELLVGMLLYTGLGAIGVTTRDLLFPEDNNFRENIALCIVTGILMTTIQYFLKSHFTDKLFYMTVSIVSGLFLPGFKDWISGKVLISILFKGYKNAKNIGRSIESEIEKELDKKD